MADPFVRTFASCKIGIARAAGDFVATGTATGGSATTLVDTVNFIDATDARLKGVNVYIFNGAGQSREMKATAFTAGTDTITVPSGTALGATSEYLLTRRFPQSAILESIRQVLASFGRWAKPYVDQSLIYGSPLVNATFYDNSGTFPNGWTQTGTGTFARESTISKHGRYSASVVSTTTNAAGIRQDVVNVGLYRGLSARLRGWVFTNTASRVNLSLDDAIDTTTGVETITTSNRGWGTEELVTDAFTVSDRASRLRVEGNITADAGGTVTAYFSGIWITPVLWKEWAVPAGSPTAILHIKQESSDKNGVFDMLVTTEHMEVIRETTRRIRLNGGSQLQAGRILEIMGRTSWVDHATAASDDDTNFDGMYEWLVPAAAAQLLRMYGNGSKEDLAHAAALQADADRKYGRTFERLPADALKIEY